MYLAAVEFGTIDLDVLVQNVVSTLLYFLVGVVVLVFGFAMVDVLTPGRLRSQVFVERRPNAVIVTAATDVALTLVIVSAIVASSDKLGQGLVDTVVYGLVGVGTAGRRTRRPEAVVPGHFRNIIDAERVPSRVDRRCRHAAGRRRDQRGRAVMITDAPPAPAAAFGLRWRALLLASVAACAACGIVYELALLTLSTSLNGGGIVATSLIVAGYVAALGVGALLVKPLLARAAITFIAVETLLGLVGGLSATALYVAFSFLGGSAWVLAIATALIGGLVGAEVPLLMTLLQRGRTAGATDAGRTLANLNAADYLGALLGGLAWPFLLLPHLGMIRGAAATGIINLVAAAIVSIFLLRKVLTRRQFASALAVLALALAVLVALMARRRTSRRPPGSGSTPTRSSPTGIPRTRRSWSPAAVTTCGCTSTAVCSSPPATSTATPRAWCTPCWAPGRGRCW